MNSVTTARRLGAIALDHLLPVGHTNGHDSFSTEPRGCRCIGGPLRDAREPWFTTCVKCGAVLHMGRPR